MILQINQVKSDGANFFEISENNEIILRGRSPWMLVQLPLETENKRKMLLTDTSDNPLLWTTYSVKKNYIQNKIPFKYLFTGEQIFDRYEFVDQHGEQGFYYTLQNGIIDMKYCVEHCGKRYIAYRFFRGNIYVVSIYCEGKQIAQITKQLTVINNLDRYMLHVVDGYEHLKEILALFVIWVDNEAFSRSGEYSINSAATNYSYSYDKNGKLYDKDWVLNNFGVEAVGLIELEHKEVKNIFDKKTKLFLVIMIVSFAVGVPFFLWLAFWLKSKGY